MAMMMMMKRKRKCGVKCSKDVITALSPTGDGPQSQNSDSVSAFWLGKIVCGWEGEASVCSLEFHMKHKSVKFYTCQWLSTLWFSTHKNSESKIQCMPITRYSYHKPKGQKQMPLPGDLYTSLMKRRLRWQAGSSNSTTISTTNPPTSHTVCPGLLR